jgi:hypothetical protein
MLQLRTVFFDMAEHKAVQLQTPQQVSEFLLL